ncbi:4-demethylwyosine synthase TYW1, partial [Candidatus Woesearchaeota archaeon]|nr:4-demethylwyosine synthase TYW1 [Candidatus Woesearchaeota archaeon]
QQDVQITKSILTAEPAKAQLTDSSKKSLVDQQYRIIGNHSAVKTCGWTKNMIRGKGGCYKLKFYGIMSSQCMQMTTSISCANRCTFCWRDYKAPVSTEWKWAVDEPDMIYEESVKAHHNLLAGFGGSPTRNDVVFRSSKEIRHVALSLTGEPIMYPKINGLIDRFNKEGISTFLVTRAQYPEAIRDLNPVTQLYISLDAPNPELFKEIDVPLFKDYWERFNQGLEYLAGKKQRTTVRLTLIKGMNMSQFEEYAKMITKGSPDFIEAKAYMHVGASQKRLSIESMPMHEEVVAFTKELAAHLPSYEIVSEHIPSRVVMLAKKKFRIGGIWHTWIDFPKYAELVNSGKDFTSMDYLKKTPPSLVGLSGRKTPMNGIKQDRMGMSSEEQLGMLARLNGTDGNGQNKGNGLTPNGKHIAVDERTKEMEFW